MPDEFMAAFLADILRPAYFACYRRYVQREQHLAY
jgi:hypothetical protein